MCKHTLDVQNCKILRGLEDFLDVVREMRRTIELVVVVG